MEQTTIQPIITQSYDSSYRVHIGADTIPFRRLRAAIGFAKEFGEPSLHLPASLESATDAYRCGLYAEAAKLREEA